MFGCEFTELSEIDQSLATYDNLVKDWDKSAIGHLKNDTWNSNSDESDIAAHQNEQEIVNDIASSSFSYADANFFVDN